MSVNFNRINLESFVQGAKNNSAKSPNVSPFLATVQATPKQVMQTVAPQAPVIKPANGNQGTYSKIKASLNKEAFKFRGKSIPIKTIIAAVIDTFALVLFAIVGGSVISDAIKTGKTKSAAKAAAKEGAALLECAQKKIGEITELFTQKAQTTADGRKIEFKDNIMNELSKDGKRVVRTSIFDKDGMPYAVREFMEATVDKYNSIDKVNGGYLYQEGVEKLQDGGIKALRSIFFIKDSAGKISVEFKKGICNLLKAGKHVRETLVKQNISKKKAYYKADFTKDRGKAAKRGMEEYTCGKFGFWHKLKDIDDYCIDDSSSESSMAFAEIITDLLS